MNDKDLRPLCDRLLAAQNRLLAAETQKKNLYHEAEQHEAEAKRLQAEARDLWEAAQLEFVDARAALQQVTKLNEWDERQIEKLREARAECARLKRASGEP